MSKPEKECFSFSGTGFRFRKTGNRMNIQLEYYFPDKNYILIDGLDLLIYQRWYSATLCILRYSHISKAYSSFRDTLSSYEHVFWNDYFLWYKHLKISRYSYITAKLRKSQFEGLLSSLQSTRLLCVRKLPLCTTVDLKHLLELDGIFRILNLIVFVLVMYFPLIQNLHTEMFCILENKRLRIHTN